MEDYRSEVRVIREAIQRSQRHALYQVTNEELSLYYALGRRVSELRVVVGGVSGILESLSCRLHHCLPGLRGFSARRMCRMRQFYEEWSPVIDRELGSVNSLSSVSNVVDCLSSQSGDKGVGVGGYSLLSESKSVGFSWSDFVSIGFAHHMEILSRVKSLSARLFYIHECAIGLWSVVTLRSNIVADLYHNRVRVSVADVDGLSEVDSSLRAIRAFKDGYLLDYINVAGLSESAEDQDDYVLDIGVVNEIKRYITSFSADYSYMGTRFCIEVAGEESFIDLLFFNRELNALVALELKRGKFRPSYLGQLNYYLSVLDDRVRKSHERSSIGIILCRDMDHTIVEYAVRDFTKPMGVSTYHTSADLPADLRRALPDMESLKQLLS